MDPVEKTCMWLILAMMLITMMVHTLHLRRIETNMTKIHASLTVTPAQLDSALVEATYRLLVERDSTIRNCVKRLGPLDPECGP